MRAATRAELLAAELPYETRTRSVRPGGQDGGPVIYRDQTPTGYLDRAAAERAAVIGGMR